MSKYVISTLTADNRYVGWVKLPGGINKVAKSVLIKGGAGIALRTGGGKGFTPRGIRTEVSDGDAEFLSTHTHFIDHMKGGYVRIVTTADEPDKAAAAMGKDAAAPKIDKDVADDNKKNEKNDGTPPLQVTTNKAK